jgi:hypothetical protein
MTYHLLETREKEREIIYTFRVDFLGCFRLALPKRILSETKTQIYAKTITGSNFSCRILIIRKKDLKVLETYPSLAGIQPIWILRHVASPYKHGC